MSACAPTDIQYIKCSSCKTILLTENGVITALVEGGFYKLPTGTEICWGTIGYQGKCPECGEWEFELVDELYRGFRLTVIDYKLTCPDCNSSYFVLLKDHGNKFHAVKCCLCQSLWYADHGEILV